MKINHENINQNIDKAHTLLNLPSSKAEYLANELTQFAKSLFKQKQFPHAKEIYEQLYNYYIQNVNCKIKSKE